MDYPVHKVKLSEANCAAKTLFQAFKSDPFMQWLMVTPENYERNAQALFETWINYGIRYGLVMCTHDFEAVAIRRKPGDTKFSLWQIFRSGMMKTPTLLGKVGIKRLGMLEAACEKAKKEMMHGQKFWHCWVLGTKPDKQRQGFGRLLMNATFEIASQDELPCYLETIQCSKAEKVHSHVGYKPLTTISLPDTDVVLTTMVYWPKKDE